MDAKIIHFIGIGGIGMSGIAKIMLDMGYQISGSDCKSSSLTDTLAVMGAKIFIGHREENIPEDTQLVVYSSAIKEDNPEMLTAQKRGVRLYKRAQMLAYIMSKRISIGVAGAHGKTTTSGMIGLMLEKIGLSPTIIIGGTLPQINSNAQSGKGQYLVSEADESDGTFLILNPKIAVVTNIESDHLDHYESLEEIRQAFAQYLRQLPEDGFAVLNMDCPNVSLLKETMPGNYITYGIHADADYRATDLLPSPFGIAANVWQRDQLLGRLILHVPGEHNISNALAAIALGMKLNLQFSDLAYALSHFTGTGRRFEFLGEKKGARIYDDYAHHPTELAATIKAARSIHKGRLIAVFQPHRYSRTKAMYKEFAEAVSGADIAIINEIYPAFEAPIPGISAQMIVEEAKKLGAKSIEYLATEDEILKRLQQLAKKDDLILIMGAGNIRHVGERFVNKNK